MKSEIVKKIRGILNASPPSESEVQHLFALSRKLIEQLQPTQKSGFSLLRFYCDWTLHSKIDRSAEGALILEKLHGLIIQHRNNPDLDQVVRELSAALSFDTVMNQINSLLPLFEPSITFPVVNQHQWKPIVIHLLEIISSCPLKIDTSRRGLKAIITRMVSIPVKGKAIVEEVAIIKIPKEIFGQTPKGQLIYCLMLTTSDTTHIVVPLILA